jgi:hypothetical protein
MLPADLLLGPARPRPSILAITGPVPDTMTKAAKTYDDHHPVHIEYVHRVPERFTGSGWEPCHSEFCRFRLRPAGYRRAS